ncbi:MAG: YfcE family phosphodiesterase [Chitinivibrionales bacterium]|nr:YfcE family phosphodiesterase [Chitinivibrionales bacterium]
MKIGVVSDTHRNKEYLRKVADWLQQKQHISTLYHLGDDYEDVIELGDEYFDVVQVPGIYNPKYRDGTLEPKKIETVQGLSIMLVHSFEKDVTENDKIRCDIILHGHTHRAEITVNDGLLTMNPGHLKGPLDKKTPPSFGLLEIADKNVNVSIYNLDFDCIDSMELIRSENRLYKA